MRLRLLCVTALTLAAAARADAPPPDIQAILDRANHGVPPTPEEQEKLRAWSMQPVRSADPSYRPGADSAAAAESGMPDDVRELIARMQRGYMPTPAEQARLKQWSHAVRGHGREALDRFRSVEGTVERGLPDDMRARRRSSRIDGEIRLQVRQHAQNASGGDSSTTDIDGALTAPLVFAVRDDNGVVSVAFSPDTKRPSGGLRSHSMNRTPNCTTETNINATVDGDASGAWLFAGELLADPARPRPYLKLDAMFTGDVRADTILHPSAPHGCGDGGNASGRAHAGLPLLPISYDGIASGAPFQTSPFAQFGGAPMLPAAGMADQVLAQLPKELRDAVAHATFSIDGRAVAAGLRGGRPFEVAGTYAYRLAQGTSTVDSRVTLTFAIRPPPSELVIAAEDAQAYHRWQPLPWNVDAATAKMYGTKPKDPGLAVTLRAGLQSGARCKLDIRLRDVSEQPGWSTNFPVDGVPPRKGLHLLPDQPGLEIDPDQQHARTRDAVASVSFKIVAEDSGAFGKAEVRCEERGLTAVEQQSGNPYLAVPDDRDDDHVADWFEEDFEHKGKGATYDEDALPAGQKTNGDGYSLYEEYRGFIVLEGDKREPRFIRTDPRKKDIFVYDRDGLFHEVYEPSNAAQLVLHYIDPRMMRYDKAREPFDLSRPPPAPEHRWVTLHTRDDLRAQAKQWAVIVLDDEKDDDSCAGHAIQYFHHPMPEGDRPQDDAKQKAAKAGARQLHAQEAAYAWEHPMRYFAEIRASRACGSNMVDRLIMASGFKGTIKQQWAIEKAWLANSITHEFGHQIGITHHVKMDGIKYPSDEDDNGAEPGKGWGAVHCAMRYQYTPAYDLPVFTRGAYDPALRYCRGNEPGILPGSPDPLKPGSFKNGLYRPSCWSQINLKD